MRLLNTQTLQFKDFIGDQTPDYAILSHRWTTDEEVSYEDFLAGRGKGSLGYEKILKLCELSRRVPLPKFASPPLDGWGIPRRPSNDESTPYNGMCIDWCWIDTCCIDKKSSAELSEAINSMYSWVNALVSSAPTITFEARIPTDSVQVREVEDKDLDGCHRYTPFAPAQLSNSLWFTRGWTLQELIAPRTKVFFDCHHNAIGCISRYNYTAVTGPSLLEAVVKITGIPSAVLDGEFGALQKCCVAKRLSWIAHRKTTREEDMAYSLLGLFQVNMPLLYGEGAKDSFLRLQVQILSKYRDKSIFAWDMVQVKFHGLLAPTPAAFANCQDSIAGYSNIGPDQTDAFRLTHSAIEISIRLPAGHRPKFPGYWLFILPLDCRTTRQGFSSDVCLKLHISGIWGPSSLGERWHTFRATRAGSLVLTFMDPQRLQKESLKWIPPGPDKCATTEDILQFSSRNKSLSTSLCRLRDVLKPAKSVYLSFSLHDP